MASTRQRGRNTELKAKRYFEALGYAVQLAPMPMRWSTQNDFFGLWDLIAVSASEILFVQVKTNRNHTYGKALDAHRMWICPKNCRKLLVLWEVRKREPEITELYAKESDVSSKE